MSKRRTRNRYHLDLEKFTKLQKRTEFTTDDISPGVAEAAAGRDIEELRRNDLIEKELEALRGGSPTTKRARRKSK
ncbi:MAG: hypothetical protein AAGI28_13040 [Pseudomonadota bacterium]